jgi:hypothetical protein
MSTASERGASNRRKGYKAERDVVTYLRAHGYPDATTTRNALGHGGTKQPADVVGPVGCAIEVKNVTAAAWPKWLRQAVDQAAELVPVVVRKQAGVTNVGRWPTVLRWDDYLFALDGISPLTTIPSFTCHAEKWIDLYGSVIWIDKHGELWAVVTFSEFCRAARTEA